MSMIPPPPMLPPWMLQNQLRQPMRVSATPQLALGPGGRQGVATLDDLAAQVMGSRPTPIGGGQLGLPAAPPGLPPGVMGQLPRVTDLPTGPLGAPGPTGPMLSPNMSSTPVSIRTGAAGGVADDLAGLGGGASGLMGKLKGLPFPKSLAGKAGAGLGIGLAGNVLSGLTGGQESPLGRFFSGAGMGGGLGATFGGAPGAVIGGIGGGLANVFMGGGAGGDSADDRFDSIMGDVSLPDDDVQEIRALYNVLKEVTGDDEAALQQIGQLIIQRITGQQDAQDAQAKMLATQALTAQFFQPFTQQLLESAQIRAGIGERLAEQLPEGYRAVARSQNAAGLDNATRVANSYAAQAQLLPAMAAMQYQQGLANQAAQQQAMGAGGGATSLADLASQVPQQQQLVGGGG